MNFALIIIFAFLALAIHLGIRARRGSIVVLLLLGNSLVTQVSPALLMSVVPGLKDYANKYGAAAGIVVGVGTVVFLTVTGNSLGTLFPWLPEGVYDIHEGILGLVLNTIVLLAGGLATRNLAGSKGGAAQGTIQEATSQ